MKRSHQHLDRKDFDIIFTLLEIKNMKPRSNPTKTVKSSTRVKIQPWQLSILESEFGIGEYPSLERRCMIGSLINLPQDKVRNWFQNRRRKEREREREQIIID